LKDKKLLSAIVGSLCCLHTSANAQSFAWSENAGWLNWSPSNGVEQGPQYQIDSITGYVWGENIGWLNLGHTLIVPPTNIQCGSDFGVGIDSDGFLFGYAWGENIGWVNFDLPELGEQQARFFRGRLLGYAWAENIGWINLDDDEHFVQLACPSDINGDDQINFFDVSMYLNQYSAGSLRADWNLDGNLNFFDVSGFIFDFGQACEL